jgi:uncharacterized protein with von Willebrand factor type A (vWA) domain
MQTTDLDCARERLMDQVLDARSLEEIADAKQALRAWLVEHPDESGMADAFEVLSHREDYARSQATQTSPPPKAVIAR